MTEFNQKLDATGLNCPLPILKAKKQLNGLAAEEVLYVVATDSGSVKDFEAFCKQTGNVLLKNNEADGMYHFYIKKS